MSTKKSKRIQALDWMRGIVMVLMAIDHANIVFNANHMTSDSWNTFIPGSPLPPLGFLTRWITHLCAPTFLFLAGTSLAISTKRRCERGTTDLEIDRDILIRGLLLLIFEIFWWNRFTLQVLYAIGMSFILMIFLRRVRIKYLLIASLTIILINEFIIEFIFHLSALSTTELKDALSGKIETSIWFRLFIAFFHPGKLFSIGTINIRVLYPLLPWLSMMMLGWIFGVFMQRMLVIGNGIKKAEKCLLLAGFSVLILFVLIRGLNGYGNMFLYRYDNSWIQWLHFSKYPPSIAFISAELGIMCIILALLILYMRTAKSAPNPWNPILVFGQTALFFYLIHKHAMQVVARLFGIEHSLGLKETYLATIILLIIMYPTCLIFRTIKSRYPKSILRYI